ncbi:MAG TPA: hypothetical protein VFE90_10240 [Myxococcales bacterium]|jgi:hypothetical protein|nr:hypothetical protein [Myxococcales bacterium]
MSGPKLVADFATAEEFLSAHEQEIASGGLLVRGAELPAGTALSGCTVAVRIGGKDAAEVAGRLAGTWPQGVMVLLPDAAALDALASRLRSPAPRREVLTLQDKMQLASSGDRELRLQLLRDPNKQLHPLVLRNPRIGLEEVQWAARLTTLNPDALKYIGEHPEWGQNAAVAAALVRNPKTPLPVALKLVPRLPVGEVRALAKSQVRPQIVQAAKKHLLAR